MYTTSANPGPLMSNEDSDEPIRQNINVQDLLIKLQNFFNRYTQIVVEIDKYGAAIKSGKMDDSFWSKNYPSILQKVGVYDKMDLELNKLINILTSQRLSGAVESQRDNVVHPIQEKLNKYSQTIPKYIKLIKTFAGEKGVDIEELNAKNQQEQDEMIKNQLQTIEITSMDEKLKQRHKALNDLHMISSEMKDMSDVMVTKVHEQGEQINTIQENVASSLDNANKAEDEIVKADEMSKGNKKKVIIIAIICLVVLGGIAGLIVGIVKSKNGDKK